MLRASVLAAALASAAAFVHAGVLPQPRSTTARAGVSSLAMGKNIYQKKEIIKGVKSDLENAQLIFSTDTSSLNIKQIDALRAGMPEGSKAICIKNRLLKRVIAGSEWEAATEVATGTNNMWIIVNDDVKGTITHFKDWKKKEKAPGEINAGVIEGVLYDAKGIDAICKLPSKKEL